MPDVRNCRRCGRMYNYLSGPPICPDCKRYDEDIFKKVKEYLYDNPGATLSQVAVTLDVTVEKIKMFLREGRLEITEGTNIILECERCSKAIRTGRFCDDCQRQVSSDILDTISRTNDNARESTHQERQKGAGLRYLNKNI